MLGIAAEHGYFMRWNKTSDWETISVATDLDWKKIVEPIMQQYTEATDGSSIEMKESALVWHHQDADPYFGSCQAKEMLDHLENVLTNEPAVVKRGQHIVEVKPQERVKERSIHSKENPESSSVRSIAIEEENVESASSDNQYVYQ